MVRAQWPSLNPWRDRVKENLDKPERWQHGIGCCLIEPYNSVNSGVLQEKETVSTQDGTGPAQQSAEKPSGETGS